MKKKASYYSRNRDKVLKYQKEWKRKNKDKRHAQYQRYRAKYKDKIAKRALGNRIKNGYIPKKKKTKEELIQQRAEYIRRYMSGYMQKRRLKLRVMVFQKDNYKCVLCGRKPPGVVLQIDHKYPKSKGGLDDIKNYQTLCTDCNIGKTDMILEEFL